MLEYKYLYLYSYKNPGLRPCFVVLLLLCSITYFAVFLGYGTQLVAMMVFFAVASLWFHFHRYKYVRRGDQFTMTWPRPAGY